MLANLATDFMAERRSRFRYPLALNVSYVTLRGASPLVAVGRTLNVSSSGFLIASARQMVCDGSELQLSLEWPSRLNGETPLQLIALCRVIRSEPDLFAVRLQSYQFHTRKA
jgi:hypothetical protein